MELSLGGVKRDVEIVVICTSGIFSEQPDKIGSVRIYGGDGRAVLAMVERARMLYDEYPEECIVLQAADEVEVEESVQGIFTDVMIVLAKGNDVSLIGTSLDAVSTRDALVRLQRYATRLVRVDVP